jgi:hypothetical protein
MPAREAIQIGPQRNSGRVAGRKPRKKTRYRMSVARRRAVHVVNTVSNSQDARNSSGH